MTDLKTNLALSVLMAAITAAAASEDEAHAICRDLCAAVDRMIAKEFAATGHAARVAC
jgi:hypothetical protein